MHAGLSHMCTVVVYIFPCRLWVLFSSWNGGLYNGLQVDFCMHVLLRATPTFVLVHKLMVPLLISHNFVSSGHPGVLNNIKKTSAFFWHTKVSLENVTLIPCISFSGQWSVSYIHSSWIKDAFWRKPWKACTSSYFSQKYSDRSSFYSARARIMSFFLPWNLSSILARCIYVEKRVY